MYLGTALMLGKKRYEMTGVFPFVFGLEKRPQAHGYTIIKVSAVNPYYRRGIALKGHEFHYSKVVNQEECRETDFSFSSERGGGIIDGRDGACYKNVLATYTHLHALGSPEWADGMLKQAIKYRRSRR
jgi:cobyrinic acid a,c-diamide synthase